MDSEKRIAQFKSEIPEKFVCAGTEDKALYAIQNLIVDTGVEPDCIVRPENADDLINIIQAAKKNNINLTVSSSRGPHNKGGFAADESHAHIDLSSWNRIEWINRRNRVCQVQPGVTYGDLIEALKPHGMTVSMPLAPRSGKSVLAAVMDREPSTWPNRQWDISDPVCSTEFIFGNGELFRTGAAGGPGTIEQQRSAGGAQKCSLGPSQTDFHRVLQGAQGTMGITTWITLRTELLPSVLKPFVLGSDSLQPLIGFMYQVQRPWLGEHSFIMDRNCTAMFMSAMGHGDYEEITGSVQDYICLQNIAGFERLPKERVKYQLDDISGIAKKLELAMEPAHGPISADQLLSSATGPCGEKEWRNVKKGASLSIFFLTTLDKVPELEKKYRALAEKNGFDAADTGIYIQPVVQNHACHVEMLSSFDPADANRVKNAGALEKEAVRDLSQAGAFFSRPYGTAGEIVFKQNPGNYELVKKVKEIFDPGRILNRGNGDYNND